MDGAEADVLAFEAFPKAHRLQIHCANPLERLNAEVKRRPDVMGVLPNEAAIARLAGTLLPEQNDRWQPQHRDLQLQRMQQLTDNRSAGRSAVMSRAPKASTFETAAFTPRQRARPRHTAPPGSPAEPAMV